MTTLVLLLCGCAPLQDPTVCRKPCPSSCPTSCFPTGYCRAASFRPAGSPPLARPDGYSLSIVLGELPPNAALSLALHAVLDLDGRGETVPWDYWISLTRLADDGTQTPIAEVAAFNTAAFPVVIDWSQQTTADASGLVNFQLHLALCRGRKGRDPERCVFLPDTSLIAQVVDSGVWERPPACH